MSKIELNSKKVIIAILSGLFSLILSKYSISIDDIFNIKLVWSYIFTILISMVWKPKYAYIAAFSGTIFIPFYAEKSRGTVNFLLSILLLLWIAINTYFVDKENKKPWYNVYMIQGIYVAIYIGIVISFYRYILSFNVYYFDNNYSSYISNSILRVNILNYSMTIFMIVAISQVLLQLPIIRRIYGLESLDNYKISYKYVYFTVVLGIIFTLLDVFMDGIYSNSRGVHLSFMRISTGENVKISIIIFLACIICHYSIITERIKKNNEKEIIELNANLERKVIQRTLELERAYNDLESFGYTISHELRTPIREIEAYVEFIEQDSYNQLLEQSKEDMNSIKKICKDTIELIQQMMDYSKAGYVIMNFQQISMNDLVRDCIVDIRKSYTKKNVKIEIQELPNVNGDRFLLKQVIFNILSNAFKFTSRIEEPVINIWSTENKNEKVIYFKDNGVGFSSKYKDKLFKMFDRLHDESDYEGHGIGLATVKKIMIRHNGDVKIVGEENKGCTIMLIMKRNGVYECE